MDTIASKYEPGQVKGKLKPKSIRKSLLVRKPAKAELCVEEQELLKATFEARDEWVETSANFDYVHEELLVDYFTYRLKACEVRYAYFLKLVKEKGLTHFI